MKVAKFELEQVLKYRREIERDKKSEFSAARQELSSAEERLENTKQHRIKLSSQFREMQQEISTIDELNHYAAFFDRQREDMQRQQENLVKLDALLEEKREILVEATKDKKVLEKLKEKKMQEFKASMAIKEQNFMDEIAVQKSGAL